MKTYNLKVTNKQSYLIQYHISDLCNHRFRDSINDYTDADFSKFDDVDVLRTNIYFKEHKLSKTYVVFKNLTEKEIKFISSELGYWCREKGVDMEPEDRNDSRMARRIIDNVNKVLDLEYQRNLVLERILK